MKRLIWSAAFAALLTVGTAAQASASAVLTLIAGNGDTLTVTDGGAVVCSVIAECVGNPTADQAPAANTIGLVGVNFGNYAITLTAGVGSPPDCMPTTLCLTDTTLDATTSTPGAKLTVLFADSGFVASPGYKVSFATPTQTGANSDATQSAYSFGGALTSPLTIPPVGDRIGAVLDSPAPGVVALTTQGAGGGGGNLLLATTLTAASSGTTNFQVQGNISAVPEPASMMLLGTGLFGLAGAARKRLGRKSL